VSERNRVVLAAVAATIVIGTAAGGLESRSTVQLHRRIAIAHLKVDPARTGGARQLDELFEKPPADAAMLVIRSAGEQQQLGFVGDGP
jgi:hypothetical protein